MTMDRDRPNYHDLLSRLLALSEKHQASGYDFAGSDLRASVFMLGWFQRVCRTVRAVRLLVDANLAHETAPLMRTLVEYGVAMKLIAKEPYKGVDIFILKMQESIRKWARTGGESSPDMDSILLWETGDDAESMQRLLAFKHLCDEVHEMDFYSYWWNLLPFSHASYEGSMCYIAGPPDYQLLESAADGNVVDPMTAATVALFLACESLHTLMPDAPWRLELDEIGQILYPEWR